ncbi:MAG: LD-carboxypeptidase [Candidatus Kapabacteria bacterium]|nr:LD-carboxypeptidase [Candidatus Kapabacteria bacterium]
MDRRKFITASTAWLAASSLMAHDKSGSRFDPQTNSMSAHTKGIVKPKGIYPGGTIAITAPASPTSMYEIRNGLRFFKDMGCKIELGSSIKNQKNENRYLSGTDQQRADEFMGFVERPEIEAIIAARGGFGTIRMLDLLDYNIIAANPKIIMGFSDVTALLNAIRIKSSLVTYHGPVASMSFDNFTRTNLRQLIFSEHAVQFYEFKDNSISVVSPGVAQGELVGGNLTMLCSTLGTQYEFDAMNKIIFIEDVSEHGYQIDRMLAQLKLAGKFNQCKGVIFGTFSNIDARKPFYPNRGYSIRELIHHYLADLGKPVVLGLPFGHINSKITLPIGINIELDTHKKTINFLESSIS